MKPYIVERYTESVVSQVAERFGLTTDALNDLGGFESFVYEATYEDRPAIIKVGHSHRRTEELLIGEAEYTRYLADHGVSVSSTLLSPQGRLIEPIDDLHGSQFYAGAWTRASGSRPEPMSLDTTYWFNHGRLLGRMHRLAPSFRPSDPRYARPHWDDPIHLEDSMHIPEEDTAANEEMRRLLAEMRRLPRTPEVYGMVHLDAHGWNLHIDGSTITLFDFDDCGFSWFADDLAIVMYYGLLQFDEPTEAAETIWPAFISGYQEEHRLDVSWFSLFPTFLSWRDHLLYSIVHRSLMDDADFDFDAWVGRFHERHRHERPIVEYDFTRGVLGQ